MRPRAPLPVVIACSVAVLAFGAALAAPAEPSATVGWPVSGGLLVGEVVTGGASGSDEYVEIYNASRDPIDVGGLELAYVTSTGATITRKATWSVGTLLASGAHLLVANSSGIYAPLADALYSGGFAATGGALVLRPIGGSPIDAVAWGDAMNAFVEGTAAPAPPANQSIERRPGGLDGNAQDTNDNLADFVINAQPEAQNLAAPPVPAPQPSATPPPSASPPDTPPPTSVPTPSDTPTPTEVPTPTGQPSTAPEPTPVVSSPSPTPSASPMPTSSATALPTPLTIAAARAFANGTVVDVIGTLTTSTGLVEGGTGAFIQDETAGIALYLASAAWPPVEQGALVRVHGTIDDRYAQRTLRLTSASDLTVLGAGTMPLPVALATGSAGEDVESRLITVVAQVVTGPDALSDGFAVTVDDGTGRLRVVATVPSAIPPSDLAVGAWFRLGGPLGQRDSSGTGTQGYRLYLRSLLDVEPAAAPSPSPAPTLAPSPSPSPTESPSPTAVASPNPLPTASAAPSPTATPSPTSVLAIAAARTLPLDSVVTVEGVVTVEPGRIIDDRSGAIQDVTAGIAVRFPRDGWPAFRRGDLLRVSGTIGQLYGNLELRPPDAAAITLVGPAGMPLPRATVASELGEAIEGLLVRSVGVVVSVDAIGASGNFGLDVKDATGTLRVFVYGTTGIVRSAFPKGALVEVTGIEGQHAPSTGSSGGHRIWPRDQQDVRAAGGAGPTPGATSGSPSSSAGGPNGTVAPVSIATALHARGTTTVEGIVTTPAGLIDADGRHVVIEDPSGALLLRLPSGATAPAPGARVVASGRIGTYYGSPQLELVDPPRISGSGSLSPRLLGAPPGIGLAWRLVRVSGVVTDVKRLGAAWRAELSSGSAIFPIYGLARSGIPSTALLEGRGASVIGVVRPPYPSATDRRAAIAPRFAADVSSALAGGVGPGPASVGGSGSGSGPGPGSAQAQGATPLDVELAELAEHEGVVVRVGGLVADVTSDRIVIDDGTARATILLPGDADLLAQELRSGDSLNVVGPVVRDGEGWAVAPRSLADIARVGRLGGLAPLVEPTVVPHDATGVAPQGLAHGAWPLGALPTGLALTGTGLTIVLRRRWAAHVARRALAGVVALVGRRW